MVLITGASKGIGLYLLKEFLEEGIDVNGTYNTSLPDKEYSEHLTKVDVLDLNSVESWINSLITRLDNIVLVNCAAINYNSFAHKADFQKWRNVIEVNLIGTFNVIRSVLPIMRNHNYGRIINFSSVLADSPSTGVSAYSASKAALTGLAKALSTENSSKGITINNINLGYANIGMGINDVPGEMIDKIKNRIPSGKLCEPKDIFRSVKYIIETEYLTGASIDLNGGLI